MGTPTTAVVFGSALTAQDPGDIDVAFHGDETEAARLAVAWADQHGLSGRPLDLHPQGAGDSITLPAPCGQRGPYEALGGEAAVRWRDVWTLAAYVRAYGGDQRTLVRALTGTWFRLTLAPGARDTSAHDWDWYVGGLPGLRSAVAKNPGAAHVLTMCWPILGRLLAEDPAPSEADLQRLRDGSASASGGAVIAIFTPGQAPRIEYSREELHEEVLFPS